VQRRAALQPPVAGAGRRRPRRRGGYTSGLLLRIPRSALARDQGVCVGVVDAGVLLQPAPQELAASRRLHQSLVDDDALQFRLSVDREHVRNAVRLLRFGQFKPLRHRHHGRTPARARHQGKMPRIATVAQSKIGECEGGLHRLTLQVLILVCEVVLRPIAIRFAIVFQAEAARPVLSGSGVVGKGRKGSPLHGGSGDQVRRQIRRRRVGAGINAEERGLAAAHAMADAFSQRV
jgi:hypothetical protein